MTSKTENNSTNDVPPGDVQFCFECLRNIDGDGKVDLAGVAAAMGHKNTASTGNRYRSLAQRYGFQALKSKNAGASVKAKTSDVAGDDVPAKAAAGKAAKKPAARKGAKKSSAEPISAKKGIAKDKGKENDISAEEAEGEEANIAVVIDNGSSK
ncbi:hypothetical protein BJX66DRAFT_336911 [Aspergillus keveii]|uniref:Myb-like DNA-binding domain-containing protein n=1 Tax=Aspergillus keveii TaxID=714993 RepID=A0ABR4G8M5_9EURO